MKGRRVVVTGLGTVTPVGLSVDETWKNILQGKSGAATIDSFDTTDFPTKFWAALKNFDPTVYFNSKDVRKMDRFTQFGMVAAIEAMQDSGLVVTEENAARMGVAVGSGIGGIETINESYTALNDHGPRRVSPFFIPAGIINMLAGQISIRFGLKGPNIAIVTACTTGTHNIGVAARMIAYEEADVMLAGGSEVGSVPLSLAGFSSARALSKRNDAPEKASRPFDRDRDGFVLGEGAGVLVLEEYEHAKQRGAKIYAEVVGFGMSGDAYHITSPDENASGASSAMANALQDAKISVEDIEHINAHGTSTKMNDHNENLAIKRIFGKQAYNLTVSATKSMTGHLLGAAGAVEAIFSVLAIRDQIAPPTINLDHPDEGCDLNYVPHVAQPCKINAVLSNSFGFGGTNGSLIFRKV